MKQKAKYSMPTNLIPFMKYIYVAMISTKIQSIQHSIFFWIIKNVVMMLMTVTKESRYGKALGLLKIVGKNFFFYNKFLRIGFFF